MVELYDILKKYEKKDDKSTHSIMPGSDIPYLKNGWSLHVPENKLDKFNEDIHDIIFNQNKYIALTDTFGEYSPLYIDIDLKYYNSKTSDRIYTYDTVISLIKLIRNHIDKYINYLHTCR